MSELSPDYSQINGFYGPGTWAAWAITLFASWIPLWRDDYKYNLHYHSYALYTNWAAIDLLRQMWRADRNRGFREMEDAQLQSLFAALAVVRVGILHASMQIEQCCSAEKRKGTGTESDIRHRIGCIVKGLLLPLFTNFLVWPFFHDTMVGHGTLLSMLFTVVAVMIGSIVMIQITPLEIEGQDQSFSFSALLFPMLLSCTLWGTFNSDVVVKKSCSVVPCAPQAIGEWDQAFSLVVALFFFFYEFGDSLFQNMRAFWQWAVG